ncbi:High affinity cAMP-specific and IBMX-insensitive 3',5'-cyclic phosphodiesterase 9A [Mortierella antarctica]|nr:High affinity cAMP-specific and IBMX-insensitive 3',5'-cyclic phosphodiesterase 9A [Mortierella antarctica]
MLKFVSGKFKPAGLNFSVWDHPLPEIYGIILGMFVKLGLVECLNITEGELLDFIIDVDRGYLATFYHSFYHAADVTAMLYHMLLEMNASQYLSKPDMAALLLAGLCHDIGHPGLNNLFQVNAKTELVTQYGETSVLEKYSCSLAMDLVAKHQLFRNIEKSPASTLPEGNRATAESMKEAMIKAIMATDMSFHYDMLNNLNTLIECISTPASTPSSSDGEITEADSDTDESVPPSPLQVRTKESLTATESPTSAQSFAEAAASREAFRERFRCPVAHHRRQFSTSSTASDCSDSTVSTQDSTQTPHSMDGDRSPFDLPANLRQSLCNCLLHAADISNAVKPWALCKKWSDLVVEEFFRQGDIEKAQQLPVSPYMDRDQHNQPQISLGFCDFVVKPYFETFVEFLPEATPFLANLMNNRTQWVALQTAELLTTKDPELTVDTTVGSSEDMLRASSPLPSHFNSVRRVSGKTGLGQEAIVSILKREAALAGKESAVNLTGSTTSTAASCTMNKVSEGNDGTAVIAGSQQPASWPEEQCAGAGASLPEHSEGYSSPDAIDSCMARFRQRRHGSLQLEDKIPSIRQEFGDGYVQLHHRDLDGDAEHIPEKHIHSAAMSPLVPTDSSPDAPESSSAIHVFNGAATPCTPVKMDTLDHRMLSYTGNQDPSLPLAPLPAPHAVRSRSIVDAIMTSHRRRDVSRLGPLDASHEDSSRGHAALPKTGVSTLNTAVDKAGPASMPRHGAPEGKFPKGICKARVDSAPSIIMTDPAAPEDGPLSCVVGASPTPNDGPCKKTKGALNGTVSIAAASAGPATAH